MAALPAVSAATPRQSSPPSGACPVHAAAQSGKRIATVSRSPSGSLLARKSLMSLLLASPRRAAFVIASTSSPSSCRRFSIPMRPRARRAPASCRRRDRRPSPPDRARARCASRLPRLVRVVFGRLHARLGVARSCFASFWSCWAWRFASWAAERAASAASSASRFASASASVASSTSSSARRWDASASFSASAISFSTSSGLPALLRRPPRRLGARADELLGGLLSLGDALFHLPSRLAVDLLERARPRSLTSRAGRRAPWTLRASTARSRPPEHAPLRRVRASRESRRSLRPARRRPRLPSASGPGRVPRLQRLRVPQPA